MIFRLFTAKPAGRGKLSQQIRELRDAVRELTPSPANGTRTRRTTMGTLVDADPGRKGSNATGDAVWL